MSGCDWTTYRLNKKVERFIKIGTNVGEATINWERQGLFRKQPNLFQSSGQMGPNDEKASVVEGCAVLRGGHYSCPHCIKHGDFCGMHESQRPYPLRNNAAENQKRSKMVKNFTTNNYTQCCWGKHNKAFTGDHNRAVHGGENHGNNSHHDGAKYDSDSAEVELEDMDFEYHH
jgi:hypothetical protein